jgi:TatD family-associated radical SAM protein
MTIVYTVGDGLYINLTNRCTNSCDFCIRNNGDGAYGSDSLWLEREPTVDEVIESVREQDPSRFSEIVFCGYGEPTVRLSDAVKIAEAIKDEYPWVTVRINTNGHSDLIHGRNTAEDYSGVFDTVSISLNTPDADKYFEMCHPVYGKSTFEAILTFAENVKNYVQNVCFSVVRETLTEDELHLCERIASEAGVTLKIRTLIK